MYIVILNPRQSSVDVINLNTDDINLITSALRERGYDTDSVQFMVCHDFQVNVL